MTQTLYSALHWATKSQTAATAAQTAQSACEKIKNEIPLDGADTTLSNVLSVAPGSAAASKLNVQALAASKANTDLSNLSPKVDFVLESWQSGDSWYKKYKSGLLEQGGLWINTQAGNNALEGVAITLFLPFENTTYSVYCTTLFADATTPLSAAFFGVVKSSKTNTKFNIRYDNKLYHYGYYWSCLGKGV